MAALSSTLDISGLLITANGGTVNYSTNAIASSSSVAQSYEIALTTSPQQVTLPTGSTWWGLTPPVANAIVISHKWAAGDTGGPVNTVYGVPCMGVGSQLTFYLWSASAVTVTLWSA